MVPSGLDAVQVYVPSCSGLASNSRTEDPVSVLFDPMGVDSNSQDTVGAGIPPTSQLSVLVSPIGNKFREAVVEMIWGRSIQQAYIYTVSQTETNRLSSNTSKKH